MHERQHRPDVQSMHRLLPSMDPHNRRDALAVPLNLLVPTRLYNAIRSQPQLQNEPHISIQPSLQLQRPLLSPSGPRS